MTGLTLPMMARGEEIEAAASPDLSTIGRSGCSKSTTEGGFAWRGSGGRDGVVSLGWSHVGLRGVSYT